MERVQQNQQRVTLTLQSPDGGIWSFTLSAGCEKFIGHYPRLPELGSAQRLFVFV